MNVLGQAWGHELDPHKGRALQGGVEHSKAHPQGPKTVALLK